MLRAAVNFGLLSVAPGTLPRFEHTEGSRLLMDSHPATIWPMARPVHPIHLLRRAYVKHSVSSLVRIQTWGVLE